MAFCSNCGEKLEEAGYCSSCGTSLVSAAVEARQEKTAAADEKYCFSCGSVINKNEKICPKCGVNKSRQNRTTALLLCLFTAVGHRFYTGKTGSAILMTFVYLFFIIFAFLFADTKSLAAGVLFLLFFLGYSVWWLIDLVTIGNGNFKDKQDNPLKKN